MHQKKKNNRDALLIDRIYGTYQAMCVNIPQLFWNNILLSVHTYFIVLYYCYLLQIVYLFQIIMLII